MRCYLLVPLLTLTLMGMWTDLGLARVERLEVLERETVAGGASFGTAGAYEKIRGRVLFTVDPAAPANSIIADLPLAPRDGNGLVQFSSELFMLRPIDPARANGTLIYEVNNRGRIAILAQLA